MEIESILPVSSTVQGISTGTIKQKNVRMNVPLEHLLTTQRGTVWRNVHGVPMQKVLIGHVLSIALLIILLIEDNV